MRFKKVTIENFKSIGPNEITVELDFNNSKLLLGQNGAGKTTIFDAIIWCIYGYTKLKADKVVNKKTKEGTKVELEFFENGNDYVITRYRKHKVHKNNIYVFENGENITLKNPTDNQELIHDIVGMDCRAFLASIILSSENYRQFLRETNSTRLQIFESVLSLKEVNEYSRIIKHSIKESALELSEKNREVLELHSQISAETEALKKYRDNYEPIQKRFDEDILSCRNKISEYESSLANYDNEIDFDYEMEQAINYKIAVSNYENGKKNLDGIMKNLEANRKSRDRISKTISEYKMFLDSNQISELKNEVDFLKNNEERKLRLLEKKDKLVSDIKCFDSDISLTKKEIETLEVKFNDAKRDGEKIKDNICPLCGNKIDADKIEELRLENHEKLVSIKNELDIRNAHFTEIQKDKKSADEEYSKIKSEINELDDSSAKHTLLEIKFILTEIKRKSNELPELENELVDIDKSVEFYESELEKVSSLVEPEKSRFSVDTLNKIKNDIVKIKVDIESLKVQIENDDKAKKAAFNSEYVNNQISILKEAKNRFESLNSEMVAIKRKHTSLEILDEMLSNDESGFKKTFINSTIDIFNEKVNTFLPFFFDDQISIVFDKDLNDTITFRNDETDFDELSSGEKTRCELCIVFALYFMVQALFGHGTNLLVIDEIMDRGLDAVGIKASKQILDDISKDTSVFVVTHRDDFKDMFSDVITVYKDGDGFTKLK